MKFAYYEDLKIEDWTKENIISALGRKYRRDLTEELNQYQLEQLQEVCLETHGCFVPENETAYGLVLDIKWKDLSEQLRNCPKFLNEYKNWKIGDFCYVHKNSYISITKEQLLDKANHINEVFHKAKIKTIRQRANGEVFFGVNKEYKVIPFTKKDGEIVYNVSNKGKTILHTSETFVDFDKIANEKEYNETKKYIETK